MCLQTSWRELLITILLVGSFVLDVAWGRPSLNLDMHSQKFKAENAGDRGLVSLFYRRRSDPVERRATRRREANCRF